MTEPERLSRYLDGEIGLEQLPPELRAEAERFHRLMAPGREPIELPPWVGDTVMRRIRAEAAGSLPQRVFRWLVMPRPIELRPIAVALLLVAVAGATWLLQPDRRPVPPATLNPPSEVAATRFVLLAPGASTVAVTGDFINWDPRGRQLTSVRDGVWSVEIPLAPGLHQYSFIVDGTEWRPDPAAAASVDDGFGQRNSVLIVPDRSS